MWKVVRRLNELRERFPMPPDELITLGRPIFPWKATHCGGEGSSQNRVFIVDLEVGEKEDG